MKNKMASLASEGSAKIQPLQPEALLRRSRLPRGLPWGASLLGSSILFTCLVQAQAATNYVWKDNPAPVWPYTNGWTAAASNILDAISAADPGNVVLVTNGTYLLTNQITIGKGITVRSVNGATNTVLKRSGASAFRVVLIGWSNAVLDGFTISSGLAVGSFPGHYGGGIYCQTGTVQNCVISGNTANYGGGVWSANGRMRNCVISDNISTGVYGAAGIGLYDNTGLGAPVVESCLITRNNYIGSASSDGGGGVQIYNTTATVWNCTICFNTATAKGGGVEAYLKGAFVNSIIYSNVSSDAASNANWYRNSGGNYTNCCTTPSVSAYGSGNIAIDPRWANPAGSNFHLIAGSPCVNAGQTNAWMATARDLDGNRRILENRVDMGAYEFMRYATIYRFY